MRTGTRSITTSQPPHAEAPFCRSQAAVTNSLEVDRNNPGILRITSVGDIIPVIHVRQNSEGQVRLQCKDGSWISLRSALNVLLFQKI